MHTYTHTWIHVCVCTYMDICLCMSVLALCVKQNHVSRVHISPKSTIDKKNDAQNHEKICLPIHISDMCVFVHMHVAAPRITIPESEVEPASLLFGLLVGFFFFFFLLVLSAAPASTTRSRLLPFITWGELERSFRPADCDRVRRIASAWVCFWMAGNANVSVPLKLCIGFVVQENEGLTFGETNEDILFLFEVLPCLLGASLLVAVFVCLFLILGHEIDD